MMSSRLSAMPSERAGDEADHQAQSEIGKAEDRLVTWSGRGERPRVLEADDDSDPLPQNPQKSAEQQRKQNARPRSERRPVPPSESLQ